MVNKSLSPPSKSDKPENQVKLKELQDNAISYLENLKKMDYTSNYNEDFDKHKEIVEVLKKQYLSIYPCDEPLIAKILEN